MSRWLNDQAFRSILKNASYLGSSKAVGALLNLAALAFAGRGMTPALFGTLAIILAYVEGIVNVAEFQTWQTVVRFGTPALEKGDVERFKDATRFAFALDLVAGAVALLAAVALLPFLGSAVGIAKNDTLIALAYCTLIPITSPSTPIGVLRALDRFDLLAAQKIIRPLLRAIGGGIAYYLDLGLAGFAAAWYFAEAVGEGCIWFIMIHELRRRGIHGALRPSLLEVPRKIKDAWNFAWTTSFTFSIQSAWGPGANLLIGVVLGPTAAGLFKIASTFFDAAGKPAGFLDQSFYPEIMRLDPASKRPWKLAVRSSLTVGAVAIALAAVFYIGGKPLITAVFGNRYEEAYGLLQIMLVALIVSTTTFPLKSLLYMASRQRAVLVAQTAASIGYLVLLVVCMRAFGLPGVAIAYVCGQILRALCMLAPTLATYRHRADLKVASREG